VAVVLRGYYLLEYYSLVPCLLDWFFYSDGWLDGMGHWLGDGGSAG
jgi:hypothetical protein